MVDPQAFLPNPPASPIGSESPVLVSTHLSLSQAIHKRRAEFTRSQRIKIKVGTWNVAALAGTEKDIGSWFVDGKGISEAFSGITLKDNEGENAGDPETVEDQERRRTKHKSTVPMNDTGALPGGEEIGLYVLGLQEIVDISSPAEALNPFYDAHPSQKWKQAVSDALPPGYYKVAEQQLLGLYLLIFAADHLQTSISSVCTSSVATGVLGLGNKGAVTGRIVLGETTRIVFVNCHLPAGAESDSLEKRNYDASQVLSKTKFEPIQNSNGVIEEFGETIGEEDFAFWFGDLNYRLDNLPAEDVRRLLMLHTNNVYDTNPNSNSVSKRKIDNELSESRFSISSDISNPETHVPGLDEASTQKGANIATKQWAETSSSSLTDVQTDPAMDPTSLQATLSSLFPHDQLYNQMKDGKAFYQGWREGAIQFLPTYKYDVGSVGMFDSSEKRRGPSWCDRILFRTRKDMLDYAEKAKADEESKRKDEEMNSRGVIEAAADEAILFDYDPETDGAQDFDGTNEETAEPEIVTTKAGYQDEIQLEHYTSHQRVISSDHKPVDAIFILDYNAVDPELKAKVSQEVARELDKAENDGRPSVTIVFDQHGQSESTNIKSSASTLEGIDFGDVKYDESKSCTLTIANTGRVSATVGFIDRPVASDHQGGVTPSWLSLRFDRQSDNRNANLGALLEFTFEPGYAINVDITLSINNPTLIRKLNNGEEVLEDVLVLRIQNGRDHFLPFRATWLQSALGRSLEELVRMPEGGARELKPKGPLGFGHGDGEPDKDAGKSSIPRELKMMTEEMEKYVEKAVEEWQMSGKERKELCAGWPFIQKPHQTFYKYQLQKTVRDALDTHTPLSEVWPQGTCSIDRVEAVAATFMLFLTAMPEGLMPPSLWTSIENRLIEQEKLKPSVSDQTSRGWIIDYLATSPIHSVSFILISYTLFQISKAIVPLRIDYCPPLSSPPPVFERAFRHQFQTEEEMAVYRKKVESTFGGLCGEAIFRIPEHVVGKARKAAEMRRAYVAEIFTRGFSSSQS